MIFHTAIVEQKWMVKKMDAIRMARILINTGIALVVGQIIHLTYLIATNCRRCSKHEQSRQKKKTSDGDARN